MLRQNRGRGGRLVLCLRTQTPKHAWDPTPGFNTQAIEALRARVAAAGFTSIRTETRRLGRDIVCLIAE